MGDLPSINDLLGDTQSSHKSTRPAPAVSPEASLHVASEATEEQFEKKMQKVAVKEKETETQRKAATLGYPHIDLSAFPISHEALKQISQEDATRLGVVCFFVNQEEIRLGALDPTTEEMHTFLKNMETRTYTKGVLYMISPSSLSRVLDLYKTLPHIKPISKNVEIASSDLEKVQADIRDFQGLQKSIEQVNTSDLVTFLLGAGLKLEASDVHVEPEVENAVIRLRLDGMLHDAATISKEAYHKLVSRIKLLSSLKLNISNKPQDGRFSINMSSGDVDVRVSSMPTVYGEGIVMRLLVQNREGLTLDSLGFRGEAYQLLMSEISRPNGMIITTGPTGSGKTTTLYAIMQLLNKPDVKVITLEDPVEYKMPGINQSQIDHSRDYTFAKGLKSILRQDPDIAMVGEIRDLETADTAIQAALTGHLILSTLHTNSAAGAIPRFLAMGVKPFLLAPALNAVIGQRLVRRLSDTAKVETLLTPEQQTKVDEIIASLPSKVQALVKEKKQKFYTAPEYTESGELGYKGRVGIYEIFTMNDDIEQSILSDKISEYDIERLAREQGMLTMAQDGVLKALDGITSIEEVFRVTEK
ncbi:MAG: type II secretion system protein E [Candidatus Magasanikbacteria bacterium CG10_big_fil_rev_8_21_14_0_10_42_10]|uniref:Type II secretion system protein E n=2 Tax=Candidatus Magasanikiibacteriota TaxID=1752731 RepID=A0A2H0TWM3_9BACT|nr:MAG: type II secretion system protein E [Candidatus Magasanikbacteria bacterium CG10_big_fil_rev_8_21_14_0_10_42_10]PIZ94475.1 MAG: type II secretion system protein E [Candidatus Magasanikbacteria bacterium CG_4_10_14_0_2_um_filter_41_10]